MESKTNRYWKRLCLEGGCTKDQGVLRCDVQELRKATPHKNFESHNKA